MATDNCVTITGNLTRDVEVRYGNNGTAVGRIGIAHNRRWWSKADNDWREEVSFFNVVVFGDIAENIEETLSKGDRVVVHGRLQQRSWETDEGEKRSVVEIVADDIAPSLRWATATVKRVEKEKVGGSRPPVRNEPPEDEETF